MADALVGADSATAERPAPLPHPDRLLEEVLDIVGAHALALDSLVSVAEAVWSDEVTSAAIECHVSPRLLLNPEFVRRHCGTRERLAALVLHELAHVTFGHTRLYPRPTPAHNVAFDALINTALLETVRDARGDVPAFAALFEGLYRPDASPGFILRPPPGWPARPDWRRSDGLPVELRELHRRLYGPGRRGASDVTYREIVEALRTAHPGLRVLVDAAASALEDEGDGEGTGAPPRLLGTHGRTERERSAAAGERDDRVVEALPRVADLLRARGAPPGAGADEVEVRVERAARDARLVRALRALLVKTLCEGRRGRRELQEEARATVTADRSRDRRAIAQERLAARFGAPAPLLFADVQRERRVTRRAPAAIYLDVSGSMHGLLPIVHAALVPLRWELAATVHLFSTQAVAARGRDFDRGILRTTGGTDVAPVLQHLAAQGRRAPKRVLVVTDGYFGAPASALADAVRACGIRIHLGVVGEGPLNDGQRWVAGATRLPITRQDLQEIDR